MDPKERREMMEKLMQLHRRRSHSRVKMKLFAWEMTVNFAKVLKRSMDILFSLILITVLSPLLMLTSILIVLESRGPVIYVSRRVGKYGKEFGFFKFRSMVINADKVKDNLLTENEMSGGVIFKMKRDPRVTRVGRFIRRYSIDELPQLFNVLIGDMSLVGPRPGLPREVEEYSLTDRKRLDVTPGITCLWQVKGRSDIPFHQQVQLDNEYIQSQGFWSDMKILLMTIPAVITGKGAY